MNNEILTFNTEENVVQQSNIPLYNLVHETDPILSEVMPEFDFTDPAYNAVDIASSLVETCKHHKGFGLSANQCGLRHRVFVVGTGNNYVAFFNPKIIKESDEKSHIAEGCLSFPHLFLNITRPAEVMVEYQDFEGNVKTGLFAGITARCILHEMDHLNGILFTKRAKPLALKSGVEKRNKLYSRFKKATKKMGKMKTALDRP